MFDDITKMMPYLKIAVDNQATTGLVAVHGLSVWVEANGCRILFDTGQGEALRYNTEGTRSDPANADLLVLSHGHYDHTGGVEYVLQRNPKIQLYAHPSVMNQRYSIHPGKAASENSMPSEVRQIVASLPDSQVHWTREPAEIAPGVWLTGSIPRIHPLEDTGGPFFEDPEGNVPDLLDDDMALWIETPKGLLVVCGCCHSGLINTLAHIAEASGNAAIWGIVGGLHLSGASEARLTATASELQKVNPEFMVPSHCTGDAAIEYLKQHLSIPIYAGFSGFELKDGVCLESAVPLVKADPIK